MNALPVFFVCGVFGGLVGFVLGRLQRELRWRRESRANLKLSLGRSNANTDTNGHVNRLPVTLAVSDDDNDDNDYGFNRETGRRAIPRTDVRYRPGSRLPERSARRSNAAPVARTFDYDCA